jgi:hypothetical protein
MKRAWGQLAGYLAAAALFVFIAYCAAKGGYRAAAVLLALTSAALVALAFCMRRAECPRCGRAVVFTDYAWCPRCLEYYKPAGGALGPVSDLTVASTPRFVAQFKRLKTPEHWVWPDADRCSVCGASATKFATVTLNASLDGPAWPGGTDVRPRATVAHCDLHEEGISVGTEPGEDESPRAGVTFRSYRLWRRFQELNRRAADR